MSKSEQKRICIQSKCAVRDELRDLIDAKDKEINELKKKRTKGEINEAFAVTIENNKEEISKLKFKVNKLQQKIIKRNKFMDELVDSNHKVCSRNTLLEKVVEEIADPIRSMKQEAEYKGMKLDGAAAVALSNDVQYLKSIATKALQQLQSDESLEVEE